MSLLVDKYFHHPIKKSLLCLKRASFLNTPYLVCIADSIALKRVQSLIQEDPTCCAAAKPMSHNC